MQRRSFVSICTGILVKIMFYGGIVCCIGVPFFMKKAVIYFGYSETLTLPLAGIVLSSGAAAVYIMLQLKKIFETLSGGNPFILANVEGLRRIAVACAIISVIYVVKCTFSFTIATGILVIVFAIASLFSLTLKEVFKQAVWYKEENDLTV